MGKIDKSKFAMFGQVEIKKAEQGAKKAAEKPEDVELRKRATKAAENLSKAQKEKERAEKERQDAERKKAIWNKEVVDPQAAWNVQLKKAKIQKKGTQRENFPMVNLKKVTGKKPKTYGGLEFPSVTLKKIPQPPKCDVPRRIAYRELKLKNVPRQCPQNCGDCKRYLCCIPLDGVSVRHFRYVGSGAEDTGSADQSTEEPCEELVELIAKCKVSDTEPTEAQYNSFRHIGCDEKDPIGCSHLRAMFIRILSVDINFESDPCIDYTVQVDMDNFKLEDFRHVSCPNKKSFHLKRLIIRCLVTNQQPTTEQILEYIHTTCNEPNQKGCSHILSLFGDIVSESEKFDFEEVPDEEAMDFHIEMDGFSVEDYKKVCEEGDDLNTLISRAILHGMMPTKEQLKMFLHLICYQHGCEHLTEVFKVLLSKDGDIEEGREVTIELDMGEWGLEAYEQVAGDRDLISLLTASIISRSLPTDEELGWFRVTKDGCLDLNQLFTLVLAATEGRKFEGHVKLSIPRGKSVGVAAVGRRATLVLDMSEWELENYEQVGGEMDLITLITNCVVNRTQPNETRLKCFRVVKPGCLDLQKVFALVLKATEGMQLEGNVKVPRPHIVGQKVNLVLDMSEWDLDAYEQIDGDMDLNELLTTCVIKRTNPTEKQLQWFRTSKTVSLDLRKVFTLVLKATEGVELKGDVKLKIPKPEIIGEVGEEVRIELDMSEWDLDAYEQVDGDMSLNELLTSCIINRTEPTDAQLQWYRTTKTVDMDLRTVFTLVLKATDGMKFEGDVKLKLPKPQEAVVGKEVRLTLDMSDWNLGDYEQVGGDMDLNTLLTTCVINRTEPTEKQLQWFRTSKTVKMDLKRVFTLILKATEGMQFEGDVKLKIPKPVIEEDTIVENEVSLDLDMGDWDLDAYEQVDGDMDLKTLLTTCIIQRRQPTDKELLWFRATKGNTMDLKKVFTIILSATEDVKFDGKVKLKIPRPQANEDTVDEKQVHLELDMSEWGLDDYEQVGSGINLITLLTKCVLERREPTVEELKCFRAAKPGCLELQKVFTLILSATKDMEFKGRVKLRIPKVQIEDELKEGEVRLELDMSEWDLDGYEQVSGDVDLITLLKTCIIERRQPTLKELNCFRKIKDELMSLKELFAIILSGTKDMTFEGRVNLKIPKAQTIDDLKEGEVRLELDMSEWDLDSYEQVGGETDLITLLTTCIVERREPTVNELLCFRASKKGLMDLSQLFRVILSGTKDMTFEGRVKLIIQKAQFIEAHKERAVRLDLDMSEWNLELYKKIGGDLDLMTLIKMCILDRREPTQKELECFQSSKDGLMDLKKLFVIILSATKDMTFEQNVQLKLPEVERAISLERAVNLDLDLSDWGLEDYRKVGGDMDLTTLIKTCIINRRQPTETELLWFRPSKPESQDLKQVITLILSATEGTKLDGSVKLRIPKIKDESPVAKEIVFDMNEFGLDDFEQVSGDVDLPTLLTTCIINKREPTEQELRCFRSTAGRDLKGIFRLVLLSTDVPTGSTLKITSKVNQETKVKPFVLDTTLIGKKPSVKKIEVEDTDQRPFKLQRVRLSKMETDEAVENPLFSKPSPTLEESKNEKKEEPKPKAIDDEPMVADDAPSDEKEPTLPTKKAPTKKKESSSKTKYKGIMKEEPTPKAIDDDIVVPDDAPLDEKEPSLTPNAKKPLPEEEDIVPNKDDIVEKEPSLPSKKVPTKKKESSSKTKYKGIMKEEPKPKAIDDDIVVPDDASLDEKEPSLTPKPKKPSPEEEDIVPNKEDIVEKEPEDVTKDDKLSSKADEKPKEQISADKQEDTKAPENANNDKPTDEPKKTKKKESSTKTKYKGIMKPTQEPVDEKPADIVDHEIPTDAPKDEKPVGKPEGGEPTDKPSAVISKDNKEPIPDKTDNKKSTDEPEDGEKVKRKFKRDIPPKEEPEEPSWLQASLRKTPQTIKTDETKANETPNLKHVEPKPDDEPKPETDLKPKDTVDSTVPSKKAPTKKKESSSKTKYKGIMKEEPKPKAIDDDIVVPDDAPLDEKEPSFTPEPKKPLEEEDISPNKENIVEKEPEDVPKDVKLTGKAGDKPKEQIPAEKQDETKAPETATSKKPDDEPKKAPTKKKESSTKTKYKGIMKPTEKQVDEKPVDTVGNEKPADTPKDKKLVGQPEGMNSVDKTSGVVSKETKDPIKDKPDDKKSTDKPKDDEKPKLKSKGDVESSVKPEKDAVDSSMPSKKAPTKKKESSSKTKYKGVMKEEPKPKIVDYEILVPNEAPSDEKEPTLNRKLKKPLTEEEDILPKEEDTVEKEIDVSSFDLDFSEWGLNDFKQTGGDMDLITLIKTCVVNRRQPTVKEIECFVSGNKKNDDLQKTINLILLTTKDTPITKNVKIKIPRKEFTANVPSAKEINLELDMSEWGLDGYKQIGGDMDLITLLTTCVINRTEPTEKQLQCFISTKKGTQDLKQVFKLILLATEGKTLERNVTVKVPKPTTDKSTKKVNLELDMSEWGLDDYEQVGGDMDLITLLTTCIINRTEPTERELKLFVSKKKGTRNLREIFKLVLTATEGTKLEGNIKLKIPKPEEVKREIKLELDMSEWGLDVYEQVGGDMDLITLLTTCVINRTEPTEKQLQCFVTTKKGTQDLRQIIKLILLATEGQNLEGNVKLVVPKPITDESTTKINLELDMSEWDLHNYERVGGDMDLITLLTTCIINRTEPTEKQLKPFVSIKRKALDLREVFKLVLTATEGMKFEGNVKLKIPKPIEDEREVRLNLDLNQWGLDHFKQVGGDMDLITLITHCIINRVEPTEQQLLCFRPTGKGCQNLRLIIKLILKATEGINLEGKVKLEPKISSEEVMLLSDENIDDRCPHDCKIFNTYGSCSCVDEYSFVDLAKDQGALDRLNLILSSPEKINEETLTAALSDFDMSSCTKEYLIRICLSAAARKLKIRIIGTQRESQETCQDKSCKDFTTYYTCKCLDGVSLDDFKPIKKYGATLSLRDLFKIIILNDKPVPRKHLVGVFEDYVHKDDEPYDVSAIALKARTRRFGDSNRTIDKAAAEERLWGDWDRRVDEFCPMYCEVFDKYGTCEHVDDVKFSDFKRKDGVVDENRLQEAVAKLSTADTLNKEDILKLCAEFAEPGTEEFNKLVTFIIRIIGRRITIRISGKPKVSQETITLNAEDYKHSGCPIYNEEGKCDHLSEAVNTVSSVDVPYTRSEINLVFREFHPKNSLTFIRDGKCDHLTKLILRITAKKLAESKAKPETTRTFGERKVDEFCPEYCEEFDKYGTCPHSDGVSLDDFVVKDDAIDEVKSKYGQIEGDDSGESFSYLRRFWLEMLNSQDDISEDALTEEAISKLSVDGDTLNKEDILALCAEFVERGTKEFYKLVTFIIRIMTRLRIFIRRNSIDAGADLKFLIRLILKSRVRLRLLTCVTRCKDYLEMGSCDHTDHILLSYFTHKTNPAKNYYIRLLFIIARIKGYSLSSQGVIRLYAPDYNHSNYIIKILERAVRRANRFNVPIQFNRRGSKIGDYEWYRRCSQAKQSFDTLSYRARSLTDKYSETLKTYQPNEDNIYWGTGLDKIRQMRERAKGIISKQERIDSSYRKYTTGQSMKPSYYRFYYKYPELKESSVQSPRSSSRYYSYRSSHCCHTSSDDKK